MGRFNQMFKERKVVSWTKSEDKYQIHFDRDYTLEMNAAEFASIEIKLRGLGK